MSVFFVFSLRRKSAKNPEHLTPYMHLREVKETVQLLQKLDFKLSCFSRSWIF